MYKIIYITTSNQIEAEKIAEALIKEKLAACVNYFPIKSIFRWKGKIQKENEIAMIVKTKAKLVDKITKRVKEIHSYETPCIISLSIEKGNKEFLKWIDDNTSNEIESC